MEGEDLPLGLQPCQNQVQELLGSMFGQGRDQTPFEGQERSKAHTT